MAKDPAAAGVDMAKDIDIITQTLGHLTTGREERATYDRATRKWHETKKDAVLLFDSQAIGTEAARLLADNQIFNDRGQQKVVAPRRDGKWEILLSPEQRNDMQAKFQAGTWKNPHAIKDEPPKCTVLATLEKPRRVTLTFKTESERQAFTSCFEGAFPNYAANDKALVIMEDVAPGSLILGESMSGSIKLYSAESNSTIAVHLHKLLPGVHIDHDILYFTPGSPQEIRYSLTTPAENEVFRRNLTLNRFSEIEKYKTTINGKKRGIYTDDMLTEHAIAQDKARLVVEKKELLDSGITENEREVISKYIDTPGNLRHYQPTEILQESNIDNPALLAKLTTFYDLHHKFKGIRSAATDINYLKQKISALNALIDLSGERAKYEPIHNALMTNAKNYAETEKAIKDGGKKINNFTLCTDPEARASAKAQPNEKNAIGSMISKYQHGDDKDFRAYAEKLFSAAPAGSLAQRTDYVLDRMIDDAKELQGKVEELKHLLPELVTEQQNLKSGKSNKVNDDMHYILTTNIELVNNASTANGAGPAPLAAAAKPRGLDNAAAAAAAAIGAEMHVHLAAAGGPGHASPKPLVPAKAQKGGGPSRAGEAGSAQGGPGHW